LLLLGRYAVSKAHDPGPRRPRKSIPITQLHFLPLTRSDLTPPSPQNFVDLTGSRASHLLPFAVHLRSYWALVKSATPTPLNLTAGTYTLTFDVAGSHGIRKHHRPSSGPADNDSMGNKKPRRNPYPHDLTMPSRHRLQPHDLNPSSSTMSSIRQDRQSPQRQCRMDHVSFASPSPNFSTSSSLPGRRPRLRMATTKTSSR